jgi:hypothetical protein
MLCERGSVVTTNAEVCEGVVVEQLVISGADSPWQAAAAKMDALLARPTIDRERLTNGVCMLDNRNGKPLTINGCMYVGQPEWYFPIVESYGPGV